MKKYRILASILLLILLWQMIAFNLDNDFLFPYPIDVLQVMGKHITTTLFYQVIFATIARSLCGFLLAFVSAFLCAYCAYQSTIFKDLFYPILLLTRSVPNVAYIIIVLVWFGAEKSATIVSFLIIFPTIYSNLSSGLQSIDTNVKKVITLYPESEWYRIRKIYIPLLRRFIEASLSTGISLTFKVGVMAEILGQVQMGIGRQLNLCRITSDMAGIFAWTGWIIFILVLMEVLLQLCYRYFGKRI